MNPAPEILRKEYVYEDADTRVRIDMRAEKFPSGFVGYFLCGNCHRSGSSRGAQLTPEQAIVAVEEECRQHVRLDHMSQRKARRVFRRG